LERLKKGDITPEELAVVKAHAKANLIEGLNSNGAWPTRWRTIRPPRRLGELFKSVTRSTR
jgi:hypothetical protein